MYIAPVKKTHVIEIGMSHCLVFFVLSLGLGDN